jgi:hypothetical protein
MARWTSAAAAGKFSEHELQVSFVTWFRNRYRQHAERLFAIPNGAALSGDRIARAKQWQRLQAEGALPGVADLFLAVPSGELAGLWIEMKTQKGRQSDAQKRFEMNMIAAGFGYAMPRSREEFQKVITSYLEDGKY